MNKLQTWQKSVLICRSDLNLRNFPQLKAGSLLLQTLVVESNVMLLWDWTEQAVLQVSKSQCVNLRNCSTDSSWTSGPQLSFRVLFIIFPPL